MASSVAVAASIVAASGVAQNALAAIKVAGQIFMDGFKSRFGEGEYKLGYIDVDTGFLSSGKMNEPS